MKLDSCDADSDADSIDSDARRKKAAIRAAEAYFAKIEANVSTS